MQTFLPYKDFVKSAEVLDTRRLGKQRVECKQLVTALMNPNYGWQHHPATKMWRGYTKALAYYGSVICTEWIDRGYKDSLQPFFYKYIPSSGAAFDMPPWVGDEAFHKSHRSNLLRKMPEWYRQFWPDEPDDLPYVWPVN